MAVFTIHPARISVCRITFLKSGRALVIPVYKSIYERRDELESSMPNMTNQYKEHVIMWSKDIRRTVDYLELRDDFDSEKLAYFGYSWGGRLGPIMMFTEKRFKTGILTVAGLRSQRCQPEADPFNFLPRVRIPLLMLNGEYDFYFPVESSQKPMYEFFGTPAENKVWKLYNRSHQVPRTELAKESIAWLNKYLGPVQ
jgi:predicted esterase